jgi:non-homologous end joining protein Ku
MPRAIESATVSFGLVSIPVNLYAAIEPRAEVRFHWLHLLSGRERSITAAIVPRSRTKWPTL